MGFRGMSGFVGVLIIWLYVVLWCNSVEIDGNNMLNCHEFVYIMSIILYGFYMMIICWKLWEFGMYWHEITRGIGVE